MEITCTRCHQAVEEGSTYCPMCGLPQLWYQADNGAGTAQPERRMEPVRDAGSVAWKPAMSVAAKLAIPAGFVFAIFFLYSLENESAPMGLVFLMGAAAAWVVAIYVRNHKPGWLTVGAGARIGFVTGILSAWTAAAISGLLLFGARYWFGKGAFIDNYWKNVVNSQLVDVWSAFGIDAQSTAYLKAKMLTPQGQAEAFLSMIGELAAAILLFAVVGGALGARFLARPRQPEV
ncbi:MAG TPA: hypothetical protein VME23_17130 [Terracidiphilus sp.]|nr:hypothetical protein [Terracidiphilus sp.]